MTTLLGILFLISLFTSGVIVGHLLAQRRRPRLRPEAQLLSFLTDDKGRTWSYFGHDLPASPLTDRLQDAYLDRQAGFVPGTRRGLSS